MTNQRARVAKLGGAVARTGTFNDRWARIVGCWFEQNIFERLDLPGYRPGESKYNALAEWYEKQRQLAVIEKGANDGQL